jgi:hypothetical protein
MFANLGTAAEIPAPRAQTGAALRRHLACSSIGDAGALATGAQTVAECAARAAVLPVGGDIDAARIPADDAGTVGARAAGGVAKTAAAISIGLAWRLVRTARFYAGAAIEIKGLAIRTARHTAQAALDRTVRAGANALTRVGTGSPTGAAVWTARKRWRLAV